jgi:hypothetical protein
MAISKVVVVDGNNLIVRIDRGVAGRGVTDVAPVEIDGSLYLVFTFSDGTTETVGPVGTVQYIGQSPIVVAGSTISLSTVPVAKGGTGQITANAGFNALAPTQTGNSGKYLKTDGTNSAWDLLDISTADITGTLPILNGGTGQTTANASFNALAPAQTSNTGKYLKTDGTNTSWDLLDISTADITGTLAVTNGGTGATTASGARTNLNAADQATTLTAGTGLSGGGDLSANRTFSITNTTVTAGSFGSASNTLTATVNAQGQLTALAATPIAIANTQISGLGTMSTQNANSVAITGGSITGITDLAVADGGTGASDASGARTNLGAAASAITISAGTGLSGGGDLSANRTLSITNTAVTAGAYGSASNTLTATVNAQGQLTALAATPIAIANTQVSGLGTMSTQNSNAVTITGGSITGITDLAIADGGTGASNAADARSNLGLGSAAVLNAGVALGVATLDAGGTVPLSQIPASIQGGVSYQGAWNASTNTPTLVSSVGSKGYYYVVSVAGNTNLNGVTDWLVGDWAIFNGSVWQKIDNTDQVASVNGYTGVVVLSNTDVGAPPTSLTISAGTGLTGGGSLAANRTLSIANTTVTAAPYGTASAVPTFTVNGQGQLTAASDVTIAIANTQVSGLGTMSTQNANSVAITGGTINGTTIGATTATTGAFTTLGGTTITASTKVATPFVDAVSSAGGALRNASGTSVIQWGVGGSTNSSVDGSINLNGTNAQIDISPTGTGHVHINPTGSGSVEINPTSAGTINNMAIGGTTPRAGAFTTLTASTAIGIASGGTGQTTANAAFNALAPNQTGNSGKYLTTDGTDTSWALNPLGTVTSVAASVPSFLSIAGSPITTSGTLAISLSGTALPTTSGGTGLTSFTANGVAYASSSSALATGSALTFDGTNLNVGYGGVGKIQIGTASSGTFQNALYASNGVDADFQLRFKTAVTDIGTTTGNPISVTIASSQVINFTSTSVYTATGIKFGIGASLPSYPLDVRGGTTEVVAGFSTSGTTAYTPTAYNGNKARIFLSGGNATGSTNGFEFTTGGSNELYFGTVQESGGAGAFVFQGYNGGAYAERLRLDSASNVGVGTIPNTWNTNFKALQLGSSYSSFAGDASNGYTEITSNCYASSASAWSYFASLAVSRYSLQLGVHSWYVAGSASGGSVIAGGAWSAAMTLDNSANLIVGGTSVYAATITSYASSTRSGGLGIRNSAGTAAGGIYTGAAGSGAGSTDVYVEGAGVLGFLASGSERGRFNSDGLTVKDVGTFGRQDYTYQGTQKVLVLNGDPVSGAYTPSQFRFYTYPGEANITQMRLGIRAYSVAVGETTDLLNINPSGAVALKDATTTVTGTGIVFPATQNASSNANTLDDYEEGIWYPVLGGSGGISGQTYNFRQGKYTKVGNVVTCVALIQLTAKGTITGNLQLEGLPFPSLGYLACTPGYIANWTSATGSFIGFSANDGASVALFWANNLLGTTPSVLTGSALADDSQISFAFTYLTT